MAPRRSATSKIAATSWADPRAIRKYLRCSAIEPLSWPSAKLGIDQITVTLDATGTGYTTDTDNSDGELVGDLVTSTAVSKIKCLDRVAVDRCVHFENPLSRSQERFFL